MTFCCRNFNTCLVLITGLLFLKPEISYGQKAKEVKESAGWGEVPGSDKSPVRETELYSSPVDDPEGLAGEEFIEEENQQRETRLRYPNFTVLFHNFRGYEIEEREGEMENGKRKYYSQFGGPGDFKYAELNDSELENEDYVEALIVKKDTLYISEQLFDDRINNTLIQILPVTKTDRFKMSFCYLGSLNQIIDDRKLKPGEAEKLYKTAEHFQEQTQFYSIIDSSNFYFRALPHTPDMVEVTVKNGKVVPKKENTKAQIDWERKQLEQEYARIKKKYQLQDTLVVIPGEYDTVATLTRNKKLYAYDYDAFLFKLQRFRNNKLVETKYIVISIAYGC